MSASAAATSASVVVVPEGCASWDIDSSIEPTVTGDFVVVVDGTDEGVVDGGGGGGGVCVADVEDDDDAGGVCVDDGALVVVADDDAGGGVCVDDVALVVVDDGDDVAGCVDDVALVVDDGDDGVVVVSSTAPAGKSGIFQARQIVFWPGETTINDPWGQHSGIGAFSAVEEESTASVPTRTRAVQPVRLVN